MTNILVCMRLADMERVHPSQDNSRVCGSCGKPVGIYPTGQAQLKRDPAMKIRCQVCAMKGPKFDLTTTAGDSAQIAREFSESRPNLGRRK